MGRFLLKLRRKSILKLRSQWEQRLGSRSRIVPIAMLIGVLAAVAAAILHELVALLESAGQYLKNHGSFIGMIITDFSDCVTNNALEINVSTCCNFTHY